MRLFWLKEKEVKKIFKVYWEKAENNMADLYTKTNHPALHYRSERPKHIHDKSF